MTTWIPDSPLPYDDKERYCDKCGKKIEPPRVTAGYVGSGRTVYGGYYGITNVEGIYCLECAMEIVKNRSSVTKVNKE